METKHGRLDPFQSPEKRSLNVLLTGATGVVGSALLPSLSMHNIVCLIHSTGIRAPGVKTLYGDVRRPLLGLSRRDFADLSSTIDVIVHAAADTSFGNESALVQTNVVGTARVVELALEAEARLVHLSTAFSALGADGDAPAAGVRQDQGERRGTRACERRTCGHRTTIDHCQRFSHWSHRERARLS